MATSTIEKVTNDSGPDYCKMPDGTQMCWGRISFPNAAVGIQDASQNYPVTFVAVPRVIVSWDDNASVVGTYFSALSTNNTDNTASQLHVWANRIKTGYKWYANWIAIGRWK